MKYKTEMIALLDCLEKLRDNHCEQSLIESVNISIIRCAKLITRGEKLPNLKHIYDTEGKIRAVIVYKNEHDCSLAEAKEKIESMFHYPSPASKPTF